MGDRALNRAFNRAFNAGPGGSKRQKEEQRAKEEASRVQREEERVTDPVAAVLEAWEQKNYFGMLQFPTPTINELGQPVWPYTADEVSRAYRRISLAVHPDKNRNEKARQAFEVLKQAQRMLTDKGHLELILKDAMVDAKRRKEEQEAKASVGERVMMNASKRQGQQKLQKQQGAEFQEKILEQVRERQLKGSRKRNRQMKSRYIATAGSQDEFQVEDTNDDSDEKPKVHRSKEQGKGNGYVRAPQRRKPRLIF